MDSNKNVQRGILHKNLNKKNLEEENNKKKLLGGAQPQMNYLTNKQTKSRKMSVQTNSKKQGAHLTDPGQSNRQLAARPCSRRLVGVGAHGAGKRGGVGGPHRPRPSRPSRPRTHCRALSGTANCHRAGSCHYNCQSAGTFLQSQTQHIYLVKLALLIVSFSFSTISRETIIINQKQNTYNHK